MKKPFLSALALAAALPLLAQTYTGQLVFPAGATPNEKIEIASHLVPSPKQLLWQNLEMTAFIHFGMNTFTDREWGEGNEDPNLFNPILLDTDQWVSTLKDAGFRLIILTAKHHDGFCLWPTATTDHSVKTSAWRDGKGDVMKDLRKSCDKYGMKLGIYLSPWDRNAACYGDSPKYNDMYVTQLTELLTRYGRIDEVWLDGACGEGSNGKKQKYDWPRFMQTVKELQPHAVTAIMGEDVRWVGNERGIGRETEWSATALTPSVYPDAEEADRKIGIHTMSPDLGSRDVVARAERLYWWPSEVDVSIRPGWFYHESEQPKSLRQLVDIYLSSVGRNSVLLLNIPPDTNGRIADADVARLRKFKAWLDANFSRNLAGRPRNNAAIIKEDKTINCVVLGEDIRKGQRVECFTVEGLEAGRWRPLTSGTTIGRKRILTFPDARPDSIRLSIESCRGEADIALLEAYRISLPEE